MGLFDFGKPKASSKSGVSEKCKLDKDVETVLRDLKKARVELCQNQGHSVSKMGQDLSRIEKKTKEFYTLAVQEIKSGSSHAEAYEKLISDFASSEIDKEIINRMFLSK